MLIAGLVVVVLCAVVVAVLVVVSGGGDDDPGAQTPFVRLLAVVPDDPAFTRFVLLTDYHAAADAIGVTVPTIDTPGTTGSGAEPEVIDYLTALLGPPTEGEPRAAARSIGYVDAADLADVWAWRDEFGFSIVDTVAAVEAGLPPEMISAHVVAVTEHDVDDAVRTHAVWSDRLVDTEHAGIPYYQWGTDAEINIDRRTAGRPLGRGGQLALIDTVAVRSVLDSAMVGALSAIGDNRTLAANGDAMAVVDALVERGVYSMLLTSEGPSAPREPTSTPPLAPYQWLGAGIAFDAGGALDEGTFLNVVVLHHADEAAAAVNLERLEQLIDQGSSVVTDAPWSSIYRIRSVGTEGVRTIAVLEIVEGANPETWLRSFVAYDSLYWMQG